MIIIDNDGEELVRETAFDIAVPVHVEQFEGETKIFAYPSVGDLCCEYENKFSDDLFSDTALDFLRDGCANFRKELGYREEKYPKNWGYNFICEKIDNLCDNPAERIRRDGKYKNLTTFNIRDCLAYERIVYAIVKDGQIVSVAVTSEAPQKGADWVEIGTETAVGYRGNGYSVAAVTALTDFLIQKGYSVLYKCHHKNLASTAVARRAGFSEVGKFYYYVLKKEN